MALWSAESQEDAEWGGSPNPRRTPRPAMPRLQRSLKRRELARSPVFPYRERHGATFHARAGSGACATCHQGRDRPRAFGDGRRLATPRRRYPFPRRCRKTLRRPIGASLSRNTKWTLLEVQPFPYLAQKARLTNPNSKSVNLFWIRLAFAAAEIRQDDDVIAGITIHPSTGAAAITPDDVVFWALRWIACPYNLKLTSAVRAAFTMEGSGAEGSP